MSATAPTILAPQICGSRTPVEKAVADSIADGFPPETFLWIDFHQPDGGVRIWYAWTGGGIPLAERCDGRALALGLDYADYLHLLGRHGTEHIRGRVRTQAYPLRPLLRDVQDGERAPQLLQEQLHRVIEEGAELCGRRPVPPPGRPLPRWGGVGPTLLAQRHPGAG